MRSTLPFLLLGASLGAASPLSARQGACATGVHIILARGTGETQNESIMEQTATAVKNAIPGSDSEEVQYPATDDLVSQKIGYDAAEARLAAYSQSCPETKIVLMGFSQGAWIMSDIACGKSQLSLPGKKRSTLLARQGSGLSDVLGVVTHGDPTHVVGYSWDQGTSTNNGVYARDNVASCPGNLMRAYCDTGDPFCDSGLDLSVHFSYNGKYETDTANWVVGKFNGASG